jgi:diguanylate cyclase (GGDEF)-like protein
MYNVELTKSTRSALYRTLRDRRGTIVESWRAAIAGTGFTPLTRAQIRSRLEELTDRVIALLLSDTLDRREAREIGSSLAQMHYLSPEALSKTQDVLAQCLLEETSPEEVAALHSRHATLLAEIGAGFFGQARNTILQEQERIRSAHLSQRRQAEEALRKSEASLAEAQRIAHLGHWDYDWEKDTLLWSNEIYQIFGVSKQGFSGTFEDFFRFVHPDDRGLLQQAGQALLTGEQLSLEHRIVRPDGEVRVVQQRLHFIFDDGRVPTEDEAEQPNDGGASSEESEARNYLNYILSLRGEGAEEQAMGKPVRVVGTVQDVTDRKVLEERLKHQASHDPLTDLPNRTLFLEHLREALARDKRREGRVTVLYLDLDNFKLVNDSFGHPVGDRLLARIASRLTTCVRSQDVVARFGGDEFTFLVEDATEGADNALRVAERVVQALRAPFLLENQEVFITASIGLASSFSQKDRAEDLLSKADTAMYRAKDTSKATYYVFEPSMSVNALEQLSLTSALRRAVDRQEFAIYYQPIIEIATGRTVGMEALVRWKHPERGLLRPSEFLPLAEDSGLIIPLGQWVIDEVCRQTRLWQDQLGSSPALRVSMNLSARELQHPMLLQCVLDGLRVHGVDPRGLELEFTENVAMIFEDVLLSTLQELKKSGVTLAIDDFGTGYSSLSHLYRLPIDALKIDGSFIEGLDDDTKARKITRATVSLGRTLDLMVVAEGVQTAEQLVYLQKLKCELAQGNYFSEPLTSDAASAWVAAQQLA